MAVDRVPNETFLASGLLHTDSLSASCHSILMVKPSMLFYPLFLWMTQRHSDKGDPASDATDAQMRINRNLLVGRESQIPSAITKKFRAVAQTLLSKLSY